MRRSRVEVSVGWVEPRVVEGATATLAIRVANPGGRPSPPATLTQRIGASGWTARVPRLAGGEVWTGAAAVGPLPRGGYGLEPVRARRTRPAALELLPRPRGRRVAGPLPLMVRPRTVSVAVPLPGRGDPRVGGPVDGPTGDGARPTAAGPVRMPGTGAAVAAATRTAPDLRPASAVRPAAVGRSAGSRPAGGVPHVVVLECDPQGSPESFEEAVRVCASLAVAVNRRHPLRLVTALGLAESAPAPGDRPVAALDLLALARLDDGPVDLRAGEAGPLPGSVVALVGHGDRSRLDRLAADHFGAAAAVHRVHVSAGAVPMQPDARGLRLTVADLADFAARWNAWWTP